jgi:hypothetical protein
MLVFFAFVILLTLTVANDNKLALFRLKKREDWLLDGIGLFFQGILIPILQITVIYQLYQHLLPSVERSLNLHPSLHFASASCLSIIFTTGIIAYFIPVGCGMCIKYITQSRKWMFWELLAILCGQAF